MSRIDRFIMNRRQQPARSGRPRVRSGPSATA